jgi:UDP-2,3-diacylglucosamine pyrophosphatase LpxH
VYRTVFVSDLHLGCSYSQAEMFLGFLERCDAENIYLVGDFIDGWSLKRSWQWSPLCDQVLERLLEMASCGANIFYTPGNHDAFLRRVGRLASQAACVTVQDELVHELADGRRFLVTHGDLFDNVELRAQWLSLLGGAAYEFLIGANLLVNRVRRSLNLKPWRFSAAIKTRVKSAVRFMSKFERRLAEHARDRGCEGVICGHIHMPQLGRQYSITYCNTGDWVEHCTALLEHPNGRLELVQYQPDSVETLHEEEPRSGRDLLQYGRRRARARVPSDGDHGRVAIGA